MQSAQEKTKKTSNHFSFLPHTNKSERKVHQTTNNTQHTTSQGAGQRDAMADFYGIDDSELDYSQQAPPPLPPRPHAHGEPLEFQGERPKKKKKKKPPLLLLLLHHTLHSCDSCEPLSSQISIFPTAFLLSPDLRSPPLPFLPFRPLPLDPPMWTTPRWSSSLDVSLHPLHGAFHQSFL